MAVAPEIPVTIPALQTHAPPALELVPFTERELGFFFRGGEPAADDCERLLAWASRARGSLDLAIGEGLDALRQGDRLASLGYHLDDYAREVLDLGKRTAESLAHLSRGLRTRPLLREALRSGKVRIRAAQTVLRSRRERQRRPGSSGRRGSPSASWRTWFAEPARPAPTTTIHLRLGFASFRHYCEERLQLPPRTVEQRAALEKRLWESPALREARKQKLSFEKLRLLAALPERAIGSWTALAHGVTCIALRRKLAAERERQMRAERKLSVALPRRIAAVLAAAVQAVRDRMGELLPVGKSLAILAWHFLETWSGITKGARSRSGKVRDRDGGNCQVPGCSHRAAHSHHVELRSRGGGDELENQVAVCPFHHLRCIHGGHLRVSGRAPDALTWFLAGKRWKGA